MWTGQATTTLLEALKSRESVCSIKSDRYKSHQTKQAEFTELKKIAQDDIPFLNLAVLRGRPNVEI